MQQCGMIARLVCLLLVPLLMGADVYRCSQGHSVRYQDQPCDAGERQHRRPWQADPVSPPRAQPPPPPVRSAPRIRDRTSGAAGAHAALIGMARDPARCEQVRRRRDQAMQQRRRAPDLLSERAWNDRVHDACR